jgi:hypothetical protein
VSPDLESKFVSNTARTCPQVSVFGILSALSDLGAQGKSVIFSPF